MKRKKVLALLLISGISANLMTPAGVMAEENDFLNKITGLYDAENLETQFRPDVRWWLAEGLNTDATLERNVQQIYDLGFGGAEILAMPENGADSSIYGWGSDEWTADTQTVIKKATENGLGISLTSGAHWANANLPDTYTWDGADYNPDNKAASQELDYATISLTAGEQFAGVLPYSKIPEAVGGDMHGSSSCYSKHTLEGVVAAKVVTAREGAGDNEYSEGTGTGQLDFSSVVDITDMAILNEDGTYYIDWTAPDDGDYILLVYWMHGTSQTASPSVSTNYAINYVDKYGTEALIDYWDEVVFTDELKELMKENGRGEIYMDSLELKTFGAGALLWGFDFKEEFKARRGYDITPYLPFITRASGRISNGDIVFDYTATTETDKGIVKKVQNDFYQTQTELYEENVLKYLQEWLHTIGMTLRAEPSYGYNYEISTPARYIDGIETESFAMSANIDLYRNELGSANMYNRRFSSETGAVPGRNYYYDMYDWTQLVYLQFVNGVNRTVFHGYSAIEGAEEATLWPGHEGMYAMYSERFNERQPASVHYDDWTEMITRAQKALQAGTAQRDIAILRTDYTPTSYDSTIRGYSKGDFQNNMQMHDMAYYWKDQGLQQAGYTYDYFSPQLLEDEENVTWRDGLLQPDGVGYQAIIVYQDSIELSGAKKLLEIAQGGVPVLFVNNAVETIMTGLPDEVYGKAASTRKFLNDTDEEIQEVINQIKELNNVKTVDSEADAMGALQSLEIYPRVAFEESNNDILTISRLDRENNVENTFVYSYKAIINEGEPAENYVLSFDKIGKPYALDIWTGKVSEINTYEVKDGRLNVSVSLAPGDQTMIILQLDDTTEGLHAISTTADNVVTVSDGLGIQAEQSGSYQTVLNDGTETTTEVIVPEPISLETWNITVQDWDEGKKVINTEEKFGHTTTEVYYETKKTDLVFENSPLLPWKDLPATDEQLSQLSGNAPSMSNVSGVGTYTTTFTLPEEWNENNGAYLCMDNAGGGSVKVYVNGEKAPVVDLRTLKVDISHLLKEGENTVTIEVASTLTNRMIERGYINLSSKWKVDDPTIRDYGLTGTVKIVPYTVASLES